MKTLVLALGNVLRGDDGVGAAVLASLSEVTTLPGGVDLIDGGTPGLETALILQDCQHVIIVDAADMGLMPGTWMRLNPKAFHLTSSDLRATLHTAGLAEALALGEALNILPSSIVIYGIQPANTGWTTELSAPVRAAVPVVSDEIVSELWQIAASDTTHFRKI